jgi:protein-S-isoprenylcysteine O-methyltransferase Ste14
MRGREGRVGILRGLAYLAATVLLYLGVPLLGWGLGDVGGFISSAPRAAYAVIVALFGLAAAYQGVTGPEGIRGGSGQPGKMVRRQRVVRFVVVAMLYLALFGLPFADRRGIAVMAGGPGARWIGAALLAVGCGLILWSGYSLGRLYSPEVTIQDQHRLITGGAYRIIRHPRYLGAIAFAFGLALLFRSWIGLAACLPVVAILLFRIRDEERLMRQEFVQEWETYASHTWRLIPRVY